MLKQLTIREFVIIKELTLKFQQGLSVVTGETGAGKSILLDALGLILGDEADHEAVRYGADHSEVEALFDVPGGCAARKFLAENNIPDDPGKPIFVERHVNAGGGDTARVNGAAVDREVLVNLGMTLAEIHGQFANQGILDPARQLTFLDQFGNYRDLLARVRAAWDEMKRIEKALNDERAFMAQTADERITLTKTVAEMKKLKIKRGEYAELDEKQKELTKIKNIGEMLQAVQAQLVAGSGAERALIQANRLHERTRHFDPEALANLERHLGQSLQSTRDATAELQILMPNYEIDTSALIAVEERLAAFRRLSELHDSPPEEIMDLYERLSARLLRIQNAANLIAQLEDQLMDARREYNTNAQALSKARKIAARELSTAITGEFPPIRLGQAEFRVEVEDLPNNLWGPLGINAAVYTARTNKGSPFGAIARIASGGELARMILALKVILQRLQQTPTLIFDEIDTGVGGATAAAVGQRIALLAGDTQVLVVTHSPQVASRGTGHMVVSKGEINDVTYTQVKSLSPEERIEEIARMIAGAEVTRQARDAAISLLKEAQVPVKLSYAPPPANEPALPEPPPPPAPPPPPDVEAEARKAAEPEPAPAGTPGGTESSAPDTAVRPEADAPESAPAAESSAGEAAPPDKAMSPDIAATAQSSTPASTPPG